MNFDADIVTPRPGQSVPVYTDLGNRTGSCTLVCHDEDHNNETYGPED
jgi:hypothetical protein